MTQENKQRSTVPDTAKLSKQPRLEPGDLNSFFESIVRWIKLSADELTPPPYRADSRRRDSWLREFYRLEPHWAGVIFQAVLVNSSRGWSMTGGRNQVNRFVTMMHDADAGEGWRYFFRRSSLSYYVTDIGSITELGTEGKNGPLRALFHVDSARCRLTGKINQPLDYKPPTGKLQRWTPGDFFRVTSLPSDNEKFNGLGYCATSRAFELTKLLYGVLMHDQEMVGSKMPKGLLLLSGINEAQWETALESRAGDLTALERAYFGGVHILASEGADELNAKLVALSQLPANFDRSTFIDQLMYGYALVMGYDPREFWPVSSGALGTATETESQHEKASTKGALEYPHAFQEKLQKELPPTLHFEFDERDDTGELLAAEVDNAWIENAGMLFKTDPVSFQSLLPRDLALSYLVDHGVIPPEYTEFEEESQATDEEDLDAGRVRDRLMEIPEIVRAIEKYQNEPIIRYSWSPFAEKEIQLWESGFHALKPRIWTGMAVLRQDEDEILYEDEGTGLIITESDVTRAITQGGRRVDEEFEELLTAETVP
jgi:hypothetical protein